MAKKITFLAHIAREGSEGSVRAKVPAGMIKAINAKEGEGIEFMVHGTTLVGAKVLTKKEFAAALKERQNERTASAPKPKTTLGKKEKPASSRRVVKSTPKSSDAPPVKKGQKTVKKVVKPSKRKTEVEYEAPKVKKGKFKGALKKKKNR